MPNIVKNTTFIGLLDLLAPHSCRGCGALGQPLCDCCKKYINSHHQNICPVCHTPNSNGKCSKCRKLPPIFIAGQRDELLGELIAELKYHSVRALAHPLAEILDQTLPPIKGKVIIVPLPTIASHIRERGFSHTHLIAKHFTHLRPNYQAQNLLTRAKNTVQVGADQKTRLTQASTAYALTKNAKINPEVTYILFDDIWTTGASLQAAYALFKKAGAKKIILAALALSNLGH